MATETIAKQNLIAGYIALTKPKIIALLVFTALGGLFLASNGYPAVDLTAFVLFGGAMAAAGANALNHYLDRDIDRHMSRTQNRPVVIGSVQPNQALFFGILLNIGAFTLLSATVNLLSAVLTLSATLFYIFVYTKGLKRTTPQNIVIGGAAGAIPPVVGWAAVTGGIGLPALYLFAIVFFWTPPHFWALALLLKDDYERAGVPMLPVVSGVRQTKRSIYLYSWLLLALTLMFFTTGVVSWVYFGGVAALGIGFIYYSWRLKRSPGIEAAKPTYLYSLIYLASLFLLVIVDSVL